ncbi:hypothetical protein QR680_019016 [Steinernema hermaphroditum]|uniref:Autophagy-related protein 9 n=1 Tax=Steinernema hermaphroditum TaxID=289476 RepID=A0AA39HLW6_9BILA|nr:hypothetical protein QR680_019016 [Steinernema hermaphroditum]
MDWFLAKIRGYQPLDEESPDEVTPNTPLLQDSRHTVLEFGDEPWDHVEDLDEFFTLLYKYHQGGGYGNIRLKTIGDVFVGLGFLLLTFFSVHCIDHNLLLNHSGLDFWECVSFRMNGFFVLSTLMAAVYGFRQLALKRRQLNEFQRIRTFYNVDLEVADDQLGNIAWGTVVQKIKTVQASSQKLVLNRAEIDELYVHQRILRRENYLVALINEDILPLKMPTFANIPYFTDSLKLNLELLLFWSEWNRFVPFSPWESAYELKTEYKAPSCRKRCVSQMKETMLWFGVANIVFLPFIFIYTILKGFFTQSYVYAINSKQFGARKYSNFGRLRIRHYNELEHDLKQRLNKSYEPASKYVDQFIDPGLEIVAKAVARVIAPMLCALALLTMWTENIMTMNHLVAALGLFWAIIAICRPFISDENGVFSPQLFMEKIIAHIQYAPTGWKQNAHTEEVLEGFCHLFPLRALLLVQELLSPFITPYYVLFVLRPKADKLVDFLVQNTTHIDGIGDVCAFASMEVAKHGDPVYQTSVRDVEEGGQDTGPEQLVDNGKIEMSLMAFSTLNSEWRPPASSRQFLERLERRLQTESFAQVDRIDGMPSCGTAGGLSSSVADSQQSVANEVSFKALCLHGLSERKKKALEASADGLEESSQNYGDLFSVPDRSVMYNAMESTVEGSQLGLGNLNMSIVEEEKEESALISI